MERFDIAWFVHDMERRIEPDPKRPRKIVESFSGKNYKDPSNNKITEAIIETHISNKGEFISWQF